MVTKARKFKKKLAPKLDRRKSEPVLSVNLIGKEYLDKIGIFVKRVVTFTKIH